MRRIFRWLGYGAGTVAGLVLTAAAALYIASERVLRRTYDVPVHALALPSDPASLAEGGALRTRRCSPLRETSIMLSGFRFVLRFLSEGRYGRWVARPIHSTGSRLCGS